MPKSPPAPQPASPTEYTPESIGQRVMDALGRPANFQRLQIRRLWENRYRINVHVGEQALASHLAHSFFIAVDDNGDILTSAPAIERRY